MLREIVNGGETDAWLFGLRLEEVVWKKQFCCENVTEYFGKWSFLIASPG